MKRIRAIDLLKHDREIIEGVEVFRRVYEKIGLGFIWKITRLPLVGKIADLSYDLWAKYRFRLTGRDELAKLIDVRNVEIRKFDEDRRRKGGVGGGGGVECKDDKCSINI